MKATQTQRAGRNDIAPMRERRVFKTFSALSFDAGRATGGTVPAIPHSPPRPTPEYVRDFNVQHAGSANGDSPEDDGSATTRRWPERIKLQVKFITAHRRSVGISATGVCPGPESTQDLQPSNPKLTVKKTLLAHTINRLLSKPTRAFPQTAGSGSLSRHAG
jgi:hypothetical protein